MLIAIVASAAAAQAPVDQCVSRILDYSTWREAPDQRWDYGWTGDNRALTVIGAQHLRDPAEPQFAHIAAAFARTAPTLAFFEGPDRGVAGSGEETIRSRGESGYVRFLAGEREIPARSLEMSPPQQIAALLAAFPVEQVNLFFVLREAARLRDREGRVGGALDETIAALISRSVQVASAAGAVLPITDLATLDAQFRRHWPDRDWREVPADWFSPLADDRRTGGLFMAAINRADSSNRNRHMTRLLIEATRSGERVFAVVGRNHVPMQAPALDCALGQARSLP